MSLETILYFTSILLTCALTGFLAWYAWRRLPLPGARAYAVLAFSECLMALTEIISMLSGTQAQALFWFNLRFLFTAAIPIIFLAFALDYGGKQDWLSKKVLAGALVIPVITQIMLWSNSLHGLWVRQEVAFHQNGPFWIVETGVRIPGLWFLVHSFYSQIFMLAGMVLIFLTAWHMRRQYLGQALLLVAGALVGLTGSIIPTFNLIPQAEFNPFIPGVGISALFYALAIFRFELFKSQPARESIPRMTKFDPHEKRSLAILVLIFVLFTSGLAAIGYLTYQNYEKQFRTQVDSQLGAIASLKSDELQDWRAERLADANLFYRNENFSERVQGYLEDPQDAEAQAKLLEWLEKIKASPEYDRVFLLDTRGVECVAIPSTPEAVPAELVEQASASLASGQIVFLDFHRHSESDVVHLSMLVPIYDAQNNQPLGVLVLRINPYIYLYPFIQRWPVPSASAETLLVRRDGEHVLYLNELRFETDTALTLRFPLGNKEVPAVKAVLGQTGIVEGMDYRGVPVIADMRPVPGLSWFLVSKMDTAEVYAPLWVRLWQTILLFGVLTLAAGVGLMLVWRQQRMNFYRVQLESVYALRESEARLRAVLDATPFPIALVDTGDNNIEFWSHSALTLFGQTAPTTSEWYQMAYPDPDYRREVVERWKPALEKARQTAQAVNTGEYRVACRDGSERICELYAAFLAGKLVVTFNDITERKQAEDALRISEKNLRESQRIAHIGNWSLNVATNQVVWSEELYKMYGFDPALPVPPYTEHMKLFTPESWERLSTALTNTRETGVPYELELETVRKDGSSGWMWVRGEAEVDPKGKIVGLWGAAQDITERKQAETILRESEQKYRLLFDEMSNGYAVHEIICDPGGKPVNYRFLSVNAAFERMTGLHSADIVGRTVLEVIPATEPIWIERYGQVALTREPAQFENYASALGKTFEVHAFSPEAGKFATIFSDITERRQMDEKLKESNRDLKQSQAVAHVGNWKWNLKTATVEWSDEMFHIFGIDKDLYSGRLGDVIAKVIHPDDLHIVLPSNAPEFTKNKPQEYRIIRPNDGEIRHIWAQTGEAILDEQGNPAFLTGIAQDITERKLVNEKLAASEVRYRRLFEAAKDGILILDAETGMVTDVNPFLVEMLGFPQEEIVGKELWELGFFKDIAANKANFLELQQKEYIRYEDLPLETADGRKFRVEFVSNVYQVNHHKIVQCNIRDITERKRVEQQLAQYTEHLEEMVDERARELRTAHEQLVRQERLAMLGQVAGSIGHELRNPLGVISNAIYFLKIAQPDANDKIKEYLDIIENETRTSDKIITELLDFTRIKSLDREAVAVSELIGQTLERYPAPASVEVMLEIPPGLPMVFTDPQHILQVLGNLTVNACQAMNDSGQLTLSASVQDDMIAIAVQDTGMGISLANMSKLFEPLFTTKTKGIGLGLAVSRKLAEANGGRIEVQSEPGKGSTFTVYLPIFKETK